MLFAKLMEMQYLKGLRVKTTQETVREIVRNYKHIFAENESWIVDKPSYANLTITALIVATHRVLQNRLRTEELHDLIRFALYERTQNKQRFFMRMLLRVWKNPFANIVRISKSKQLKMYGSKHFTHEMLEDNDQSYRFHIKKCFYYNFLKSQGVPELAVIFCETDNVWGELIDPQKHGVRFDRPYTLAQGHTHCQFSFRNTSQQTKQG